LFGGVELAIELAALGFHESEAEQIEHEEARGGKEEQQVSFAWGHEFGMGKIFGITVAEFAR
jgi:hypothetical protein